MATIELTPELLRVRLTPAEKLWALRGDLTVPRTAIREVSIVADGVHGTRGLRAPGLGLPGVRKVGTWRGAAGRELVSVRAGQPAVRITLDGQPYASLLIGTAEPERVAGAVRG
ncbi:hypothetical protein MRQ36_09910 [Micromonospora sp. R77]|uniref:hypothetical protein n=1 Tax=Micromonospora sp. R77 TaxID=2925836 RepID=UPI001F613439|nr:hypothetical protein [Micromonospora sp. R77]MCI4062869.1 hypothetical protein [Micromonospora sp. R77]